MRSRTPYTIILVLDALAGLTAVATVGSISAHQPLVSYGLKAYPSGLFWVLSVYATLAVLCLGMAVVVWRWPRWWTGAAGAFAAIGSLVLGSGGLYALEVKYEKGDSNLARLARHHLDRATWETRAETLRAGILRAARLWPLPERTPLNAARHSRRVLDGFSVENLVLESAPGFFLPANLYIGASASASRRAPVVLLAQGHFPDGRFHANPQILAANLARMGAIVISYDMVGRGESSQLQHEHPEALRLQLWNSMRVLDFALSMPEADADRVGMTGASGGGTQTFLCAAVDARISVSAPVVMVSSWVYGGCPCESGLPIHRGPGYATNNAEIAALTAPRPQLIVSIGDDWTRTVPELEYPFLQGIYRLLGAESSLVNVHLRDEKHDLGPSKRAAVYEFLATHLKLDLSAVKLPGGGVLEYDKVEAVEVMRAFNDAHPLPVSAIRSWSGLRLPPHAD